MFTFGMVHSSAFDILFPVIWSMEHTEEFIYLLLNSLMASCKLCLIKSSRGVVIERMGGSHTHVGGGGCFSQTPAQSKPIQIQSLSQAGLTLLSPRNNNNNDSPTKKSYFHGTQEADFWHAAFFKPIFEVIFQIPIFRSSSQLSQYLSKIGCRFSIFNFI